MKFMKWHLVYFVQGFMHPLWWLQSPEIITCNSVLVSLAHAIISMLELAPRFIFHVQTSPFICKQNKCIQFRPHHILMNIRIVTKKRKYLIIQLARASSSNWSSMYSSRGCGCNNGIYVLINKAFILYSQYPDCNLSFLLVRRLLTRNRPSWSG